jgi:hypothetical protein
LDDIARDVVLSAIRRSERVRSLWKRYARQRGGLIRDMIADLLHLIEAEGGDPYAEARQALIYNDAEREPAAGRVGARRSTWC